MTKQSSHLKSEGSFPSDFSYLTDYAGIGLRHPHYFEVYETKPEIGWLEVHTENFMTEGGPHLTFLEKISKLYPLSFHGVCLSLGSADGLSRSHLREIKRLTDRFQPIVLSEHLSWGRIGTTYLHDLLPIPYTKESLILFCDNLKHAQDFLGRRLFIENPSSYLTYRDSSYRETEFLLELCRRTGAGLLLDINNVYVSCHNHGWDPTAYLNEIDHSLVGEIHLAGHTHQSHGDATLKIDDHGSPVSDQVWEGYTTFITRGGPRPTLIEWDSNIPDLKILIEEAEKASRLLNAITLKEPSHVLAS